MPRHAIYAGWSIDVAPGFAGRRTDDGFVIFERSGHTIWTVIYEASGPTPEVVLSEFRRGFLGESEPNSPSEFPFSKCHSLVGYARSMAEPFHADRSGISTLAAATDCIANIDFEFSSPGDLELALEIWRTVEYDESDKGR